MKLLIAFSTFFDIININMKFWSYPIVSCCPNTEIKKNIGMFTIEYIAFKQTNVTDDKNKK